jgi:hypothetical protein
MTRSSNGLTMSGSGFKGNYWRKQCRGHGPKSPWMAYVPVSELFFIKRYIGSYYAGSQILAEPEHCFKFVGVFRLPEILQKIESKELGVMDYIQQEDDVGWENSSEFAKRLAPKKKRPKTSSKKLNKKQPRKKRLVKVSKPRGKCKLLVKSKARRPRSK